MSRMKPLGFAAALALGLCATAAPKPPTTGVPFNGKTTYAVVKDGKALDLGAFTLSAWVKLRQTKTPQVFVTRGEAGQLFTLYLYKGGVRMLVEFGPGAYTHATVPIPPADTWVHFAGTYDGKAIKNYVNGTLKATKAIAGRIPKSEAPLYIGALVPGERVLDGWIDDVRVWKRSLAGAEVAAVAEGKPVADGLLGCWARDSLAGERWGNAAGTALAATYKANPKVKPRLRPTGRRPDFTAPPQLLNTKADGYRGIWYSNQRQNDEYVYKYSGGLGTYCGKHYPFAIYAKAVNKTFFCYGGTDKARRTLLHMVSCYDHATGTVPRPTILLDKKTTDAHDNPVISMDDKGYIWIFSSSHGTGRPSYICVSKKPYDVSEFDWVLTTNFSYTQPWHIPGQGFLFLHTLYGGGRRLHQMSSPDGRTWTKPQLLAAIASGHYQVSGRHRNKVGTAFNFHPAGKGLNWRANVYYMETDDFGKTWRAAHGQKLDLPLTKIENPALVYESLSKKRNCYMKGVAFDSNGHPVILFLTSGGWQSGPVNDPRTWTTARWTGSRWDIRPAVKSDNNYDTGSLTIERDDLWRIIGPTQTGPQPYNTGGEVAMWTSSDQGKTWKMVRQLTRDSKYNHTYCRSTVNAHPGFYAFWADGHGRKPSESRLYFCDKTGDHVWMLPPEMAGDTARPTPVGGHQ